MSSSIAATARMKAVRNRDTACEISVRVRLHRAGLRYRVDARPLPHKMFRADVVFRRARVAVFIDGCFWHGCPLHATMPRANANWWKEKLDANKARDARANDYLSNADWLALRFWEHEEPSAVASAIAQAVSERTLRS